MKLSEFQSKIGAVIFDRENTFAKYKYATLHSILQAIRAVGGVGVSQVVETDENESIHVITSVTGIDDLPNNGIRFKIPPEFLVPIKGCTVIQQFGSAVTYVKRYCLAAMLGIVGCDEDDDAAAMPETPTRPLGTVIQIPRRPEPKQESSDELDPIPPYTMAELSELVVPTDKTKQAIVGARIKRTVECAADSDRNWLVEILTKLGSKGGLAACQKRWG